MYFSQSHSEQIPHLDLKRGKSGYSGNSSKSGDSCESSMLAILVILRNLAILMFLVHWGIMVIMMNLSNFCDHELTLLGNFYTENLANNS